MSNRKASSATGIRRSSSGKLFDVQLSGDGSTVWVHSDDGSTVGRFSRRFGLDVHRTVTEQLAGKGQCLHCTHEPAGEADWMKFCSLMQEHFGVTVDASLLEFEDPGVAPSEPARHRQ